MAKIKIAQNPTFKADVMIPRVGGEPVAVGFEFRYMDRSQLSELFDAWNKGRDDLGEKTKQDGVGWQEITSAEIKLQVDQINAIVVGWDFDDEFSDEAVASLVRACIGAPRAVLDAYQAAYSPARLGN